MIFQIGKDIRPISNPYSRNVNVFQGWLENSATGQPLYEETTTTFPVNASGSVIETTTTKSGSGLLAPNNSNTSLTSKVYSKNEDILRRHSEMQLSTTSDWKVKTLLLLKFI